MRSVVNIPSYNEAVIILTTLDAVLREAAAVDVLVVDDNSPDGTAAVVAGHPELSGRLHLLSRSGKDGIRAAYRAGFAWALLGGYDAVAQINADLSHPPARLPALLAALGDADVAVGSRYVDGGGVRDWPVSRRAISRAGNGYCFQIENTSRQPPGCADRGGADHLHRPGGWATRRCRGRSCARRCCACWRGAGASSRLPAARQDARRAARTPRCRCLTGCWVGSCRVRS